MLGPEGTSKAGGSTPPRPEGTSKVGGQKAPRLGQKVPPRLDVAPRLEQPEGCLNEACADKQTVWVTRELAIFPGEAPVTMSRCSHCGCPKSYNRTWARTLLDGMMQNREQMIAASAMLQLCPSLAHTRQDTGLAALTGRRETDKR